MNLSDFRTRVARTVGMSTSDSGDLALLDSWANEAVEQFLKDTKVNIAKASLAVTAGQGDYTLDADILAFTDAWYEPASGTDEYLLEAVDSSEIIRLRLFEDTTDSTPSKFAMQGANLLMLHPDPQSSSDSLHILYVAKAASSMTAAAHTPATAAYGGIPTEYHPVLESYVLFKAARAEEHRPSENGLQFQADYERGVAKVRADMNKKAGIHKGGIMWGRRNRRRTVSSPGVDLGG